MQNNNYLSRDKTQALIDELGVTKDEGQSFLKGLADKGYTIEGYNDQKPEQSFTERVGQDVQNRVTKLGESLTSLAKPPTATDAALSPITGMANPIDRVKSRILGQLAGVVGDTQLEAIKSIFDTADQATGEYVSSSAKSIGQGIMESPVGPAIAGAANLVGSAYNTAQTYAPQTTQDVADKFNMASVAPSAKTLQIVGGLTANTAVPAIEAGVKGLSPVLTGTGQVLKSAGRTLKSIPENVATNVGEMQAREAAINAIPSTAGQQAVRKGIDLADAKILQDAVGNPESKKLIDAIKNYASDRTSISPFEVVGKPVVDRLKTLDSQVKQFAGQLDTIAQNLKGQAVNDMSRIQTSVLDGLYKLQVNIADDGLDFVGSALEGVGTSGKILDNVFQRIGRAKDAFDLHNLKKYIDSNISYGKKMEGLDATAERTLKSWRKAIDDTLDTQFVDYNAVNTKLAERISPLEDLKSLLKNADGLDADLLSQKAGILARRITSAAASNPEIKQILRNLDAFTSGAGKTLGSVEKLQDLYNVLNKYYDIAPKTGFQNLVKEGVDSVSGFYDEVASKVKGFAGDTNATRQKALENYLDELLNPAKPSIKTNTKKSTNAVNKNVIMKDGIPQSTKKASGKLGGFAQFLRETPDGKLKGKMVPEDADAVVDFADVVENPNSVSDKMYLKIRKEIKGIAKAYNVKGKSDRELVDALLKKIYNDYHKFPGFSELGLLPKLAIGTALTAGAIKAGVELNKK